MAGDGDTAEQPKPTDIAEALVPTSVPWQVAEGFALLAVFMVLQVFFGMLAHVLCAEQWRLVYGTAASSVASGAAALLLLRAWARGRAPWYQLVGLVRPKGRGFAAVLPVLVRGAGAYVLAAVAVPVLLRGLGVEPQPQAFVEAIRNTHSASILALEGLVAVAMAPFVEEVFFRGILYLPLRSRLGVFPAALIVSGVFAAVHFYPYGVLQLAIVSLVLIALFERTGTLWASILAHALYNGVTFLFILTVPQRT